MSGYTESGVIGRPSLATAEKGRAILDSLARSFKDHLALLLCLSPLRQGRPCGRPPTAAVLAPAATRQSPGSGSHPSPQVEPHPSAWPEQQSRRGLGQHPSLRTSPATPAKPSPVGGRSSAGVSPAQALGLGSLLRRHLRSPVGMLPGLGRQWATLSCQPPVHARNVLLGRGNRLRRSSHLLPQRLALRLRLLGSLEQIGTVGVRVGHNGTSILPSPFLPAPRRMGHLGEGRGLGLRPWPAEPLLGDVWRVEGVGVPAQHLGGDGEQRRRIDALAGRPICLGGRRPGGTRAEGTRAGRGSAWPDPISDRHLLQEPCDFSGQGLRVQLLYWVVVEVALVLMHALHRAEAHVPALATSGWLYPWPCRITGSWRSGLAAHRRRAWRRPSRTVPHRVAWLLRLEGSVRGVRGAVSGGWRATPAEAPGAGARSW
jgi:hypothetical protein